MKDAFDWSIMMRLRINVGMDEMYKIGWFIVKFEYEYSRICVGSVVRAQTLC